MVQSVIKTQQDIFPLMLRFIKTKAEDSLHISVVMKYMGKVLGCINISSLLFIILSAEMLKKDIKDKQDYFSVQIWV